MIHIFKGGRSTAKFWQVWAEPTAHFSDASRDHSDKLVQGNLENQRRLLFLRFLFQRFVFRLELFFLRRFLTLLE